MVVLFFVADASSLTSYPLSLHPELNDDGFARRKQRRNRTTFTLQQVSVNVTSAACFTCLGTFFVNLFVLQALFPLLLRFRLIFLLPNIIYRNIA